jgi:hypothetical protein
MAEVNQQTDSLIEHIVPLEPAGGDAAENGESNATPKAKKTRTSRASAASAETTRSRKADTNPRTPHVRPSQRGFKWPVQEQPAQPTEPGEEE